MCFLECQVCPFAPQKLFLEALWQLASFTSEIRNLKDQTISCDISKPFISGDVASTFQGGQGHFAWLEQERALNVNQDDLSAFWHQRGYKCIAARLKLRVGGDLILKISDSKSGKIYLMTMLTEMEIVGFTLREKFYTLLNLHISVWLESKYAKLEGKKLTRRTETLGQAFVIFALWKCWHRHEWTGVKP